MLNDCINFDKVVTYGLDDNTVVFINNNTNLKIKDGSILCYVYFKDIVNIKYIEINAKKSQNVKMQIWNYNMNIDFSSNYPNIEKTINTNNKHHIDNKYFDLKTDYFTIILSNITNIYNITFYGKYDKYDTRKLEQIKINFKGGNCNEGANNVKCDTTMSNKIF